MHKNWFVDFKWERYKVERFQSSKYVDGSIREKISFLADSHDEAVRTSFDGVQFNCFHNVWSLNLNRKCHLERFYTTSFSFEELVKILLTLGDVAESKSATVTTNAANFLSKGELSELSVEAIKATVARSRSRNESDVGLRKLKTFILALGRRYVEYGDLVDEIRSYKVLNNKPSVYDAEKGALTHYEHESVKRRVDEFSRQVLIDVASGETSYSLFIRFRQLIIMRLLTITVRRPSQIAMLKWCDIRLGRTSIKNEFSISMPSAKKFTSRGFRSSFEDTAIPIDEEFSRELFEFKSFTYSLLVSTFDTAVDGFCSVKFEEIFENFPLLPHVELFQSSAPNYIEIPHRFKLLERAIKPKSSTFHVDGGGSLSGVFEMLKPIASDRSVDINTTLGCQRLRHTVGSRMAVEGFDNLAISSSLGNTPKAAKYYIDLLPSSRVEIDKAIVELRVLSKRFSGKLVSQVEKERAIFNDSGDICGGGDLVLKCVDCVESRPIGCYGCDNFRPLIGADHKASLNQVVALHKKWLDLGASKSTLMPIENKIKNIEITISACNLAKKDRVLGAS